MESDDDPVADVDPTSLIAEVIGRAATDDDPGAPPPPTGASSGQTTPTPRAPRGPLPDLDDVQLTVLDSAHAAAGSGRSGTGGATGAPSWWVPRDDRDQDEDRELGRRGERLVLRHLQSRLSAEGRSPDLAVCR